MVEYYLLIIDDMNCGIIKNVITDPAKKKEYLSRMAKSAFEVEKDNAKVLLLELHEAPNYLYTGAVDYWSDDECQETAQISLQPVTLYQ